MVCRISFGRRCLSNTQQTCNHLYKDDLDRLDENVLGVLSVKITKHKVRKEDPYDIPIIYWSEAGLRLASTARVSKVTVLNKDSFIFKIGNLHNDDMDRIEAMYSKFLEDNNII